MTDKSVVSLLPSFRKEGCPLGRGGRHPWLCAFILSLAYVLASCTQEPLLPYDGAQQEYMNFSLELTPPGAFMPADTRGIMSDAKQNAVSSAEVLVFKDNKLLSHHAGTVSDVDGIKKKVNVTLKTSQSESDLFDIMVIGNPPTDFSFASYVGKTKDELKANFNVEVAGKWASEFIMYGEVLQTLVKPSTRNFNIQLLRSLARVDIGVGVYNEASDTWAGLPGFKLTEVRVVNSRDKFAAIPAATVVNESGNVKVSAPTIPADAGLQGTTAGDAIKYSAEDITDGAYIKSAIFLAEEDPNTSGNIVTLLVGGSYLGGATTYYRIDMCVPKADAPGTFDYFNILRNHLYRISITGVSGAGFADPQEALLSVPINITTTLTPIEEGGAGDVVFDGNSYIHTDASSVLIYGAPDGVKTYQIATVKAGFAAGVPATITGLGITSAIPLTSGVATPVSVALPAGTTTGNLTIKVGRLSKVITVGVQPPVDAHFDFLPFQNVQSISITNPQPWLTLSQSTTYVKSEQQSSYIAGNSAGKACVHFDENIATTGAPRMAQALLRRSNSGEITRVYFEQRNLAGMVLGYFGGAKDNYGYTKQLAFESVEEYNQRVYDDTSIGTTTNGMQWGFNNRTTNFTDKEFGQFSTIELAKRAGSGVALPYTIYNTYAARYCYDKNRDINSNGIIDNDEVVWYLPAQNQLMGAWIAREGVTYPFDAYSYWSATEYISSHSWNVHFGIGYTDASYKYGGFRVRCVRELMP